MKRRQFITLLGGAAAWPLVARAQQRERMRSVGVLLNLAADDPMGQARVAAFVQGLQAAGWSDGRNVRIDTRWAAADPGNYRKYAAELIALGPDVILASTTAAVVQLQQASRAVPIVFVSAIDPVGSGLITSMARPGGEPVRDEPSGAARRVGAHKLPAVYPFRYFASAGGLISYGSDQLDEYHRAAAYVDRILKGEKPADLPVQAPTKHELVINLKTAKAMCLTVPETLLAIADEVIE
jgi:ABC-type uncharacterized transport system substrate-binding protein